MPALQRTTPSQPPALRSGESVADLSQERIKRRPVLGGLVSEYQRAAYEPRSRPVGEFWHPTGPRSQRLEGGCLAGAGESVAAVEPVTAGHHQAECPAHVARRVDGPTDVLFVRSLTGPALPEPLFGDRLPHGRLDLAVRHRIGVQQQGKEQLTGEHAEVIPAEAGQPPR